VSVTKEQLDPWPDALRKVGIDFHEQVTMDAVGSA
jgi:hypothetical protein